MGRDGMVAVVLAAGMVLGGCALVEDVIDRSVDPVVTTPDDPVAAIDAAIADLEIRFDGPPELQWRPRCGPTDELLGRELVLDITLPDGFVAPDDWTGPTDSGWTTPEGARVHHFDEGMAQVTAPATSAQLDASDRVPDDPVHMCG